MSRGWLQHRKLDEVLSPPQAFEEVFAEYGRFVWRVLARLGVRTSDLADVCQEVFIVVHRRLRDFDPGRSVLRSWIYGICVRAASEYRRRHWTRRVRLTSSLPDEPVMPEQHESLERRRAGVHLERVLDAMEENRRAVFVLYELEELSMSEVAEALGCPLQTAYSRLHAARREVSAAFEKFRAGELR